jgi:hypothetical protein
MARRRGTQEILRRQNLQGLRTDWGGLEGDEVQEAVPSRGVWSVAPPTPAEAERNGS